MVQTYKKLSVKLNNVANREFVREWGRQSTEHLVRSGLGSYH